MRPVHALVALLAACGEHVDECADVPPAPPPVVHAAPHAAPPKPIAVPHMDPDAPARPARPHKHKTRAQLRRWYAALSRTDRADVDALTDAWRADPCSGALRPRPSAVVELTHRIEQRDQIDDTSDRYDTIPHSRCNTPLVASFDGGAIDFAPAGAHAFAFVPGQPVASNWPTASTPWIVLDRDGDGRITSGAELFGDATLLPDGTTARDGFAALAALDANGDGVLDARDPAFASLLLWSDRNGDRASSPDELVPLASSIESISLRSQVDARCTSSGDCEGGRAEMIWRDARGRHAGAIVDVYLKTR